MTVTPKGDPRKVKVTGSGLGGGIAGLEWKVLVDTVDAGPGKFGEKSLKMETILFLAVFKTPPPPPPPPKKKKNNSRKRKWS